MVWSLTGRRCGDSIYRMVAHGTTMWWGMRDEQRGHHESCDFETKPAPSAGEAKPEGRGDETTKSHAAPSRLLYAGGERRGTRWFGEAGGTCSPLNYCGFFRFAGYAKPGIKLGGRRDTTIGLSTSIGDRVTTSECSVLKPSLPKVKISRSVAVHRTQHSVTFPKPTGKDMQ